MHEQMDAKKKYAFLYVLASHPTNSPNKSPPKRQRGGTVPAIFHPWAQPANVFFAPHLGK
jgi:hypothetical protein